MGKCLVTKLNGSTSNVDLLRLGEARIKFDKVSSPSRGTQSVMISVSQPTKLEIVGNGYFTDEKLSANNGKTKTISTETEVFVSNDTLGLAILDKYNLTKIFDYENGKVQNKELDLNVLSYSKGLKYLNASSINLSGDISALGNLTALTLLNLSGKGVFGDISALGNLTALTSLGVKNTHVSGDLGTLNNLTGLTAITINRSPNIFANLEKLNQLTKLDTIFMSEVSLNGDVATLAPSVRCLVLANYTGTITWSTRPTTSKIIALSGVAISNIDEMLTNQAKCKVGFNSSDMPYFKTISVKGTRTSASDAAVATLQQKGYTVSITPA